MSGLSARMVAASIAIRSAAGWRRPECEDVGPAGQLVDDLAALRVVTSAITDSLPSMTLWPPASGMGTRSRMWSPAGGSTLMTRAPSAATRVMA